MSRSRGDLTKWVITGAIVLVAALFFVLPALGDLNPIGGVSDAKKWVCTATIKNDLLVDASFASSPSCSFGSVQQSCNVFTTQSFFGITDENTLRVVAGTNIKTVGFKVDELSSKQVTLEGCVSSSVPSLQVELLNKDNVVIDSRVVSVQ